MCVCARAHGIQPYICMYIAQISQRVALGVCLSICVYTHFYIRDTDSKGVAEDEDAHACMHIYIYT
jgi:hypothetical protein